MGPNHAVTALAGKHSRAGGQTAVAPGGAARTGGRERATWHAKAQSRKEEPIRILCGPGGLARDCGCGFKSVSVCQAGGLGGVPELCGQGTGFSSGRLGAAAGPLGTPSGYAARGREWDSRGAAAKARYLVVTATAQCGRNRAFAGRRSSLLADRGAEDALLHQANGRMAARAGPEEQEAGGEDRPSAFQGEREVDAIP